MNIFLQKNKRGFTLIELLVVIAIIAILVSIILASMSTARQNAREKKRVSDLGNIELALSLFKEGDASRKYPTVGITEIGVGNTIDTTIKTLSGNTYKDPSSAGEGGTYGYWYDSNFECSAPGQTVIYAKTMEQAKNGNVDSVCTTGHDAIGNDAYIVILKP